MISRKYTPLEKSDKLIWIASKLNSESIIGIGQSRTPTFTPQFEIIKVVTKIRERRSRPERPTVRVNVPIASIAQWIDVDCTATILAEEARCVFSQSKAVESTHWS